MKEKRDRLFKRGRPHIRPLQIIDGDRYHQDIGILWVAHQKKPIDGLPTEDQESFVSEIQKTYETRDLMIAEDLNKKFKSGKGPVGLFWIINDGWRFEPHVHFFPWATCRNRLSVIVSFLQWIRYQKGVGVCVVYTLKESTRLFDKVCEYGVLHKVGEIINGTPKGTEYIYSIRGPNKGV